MGKINNIKNKIDDLCTEIATRSSVLSSESKDFQERGVKNGS